MTDRDANLRSLLREQLALAGRAATARAFSPTPEWVKHASREGATGD